MNENVEYGYAILVLFVLYWHCRMTKISMAAISTLKEFSNLQPVAIA